MPPKNEEFDLEFPEMYKALADDLSAYSLRTRSHRSSAGRTLLFWLAISSLLIGGVFIFRRATFEPASYSQIKDLLERRQVVSVSIGGRSISVETTDGRHLSVAIPETEVPSLWARLVLSGAILSPPARLSWVAYLSMIVGGGVIGCMFALLISNRLGRSAPSRSVAFGRSRVRLHSSQQKKVTLNDFVGNGPVEQVRELVGFLREPQKYQKLGGRISKGVLLVGPPGSGKTLLARGLAGEANVPFFALSGSDFVEMFSGIGASRVRDLFEQGKKNAPCLIFIDEIDSVGRRRSYCPDPLAFEQEHTLNQLLNEMDGFDSNEGVLLIAATNRPDLLDDALVRPGRFDNIVEIDYPTAAELEAIFRITAKKLPVEETVDWAQVAAQAFEKIRNATGGTVAAIVNRAAVHAAKDERSTVSKETLFDAVDQQAAATKAFGERP